MKTLIIRINERSKAGKAFMRMAETEFKHAKGIEFIDVPSKLEAKDEKIQYNLEFVAKILKAEKRGEYTRLDPNDIWGSIMSK